MLVWVARDRTTSAIVSVWQEKKPTKTIGSERTLFMPDYENGDCMGSLLNNWAPKKFKQHFGFTPRKGSCKQMELSLKEIK